MTRASLGGVLAGCVAFVSASSMVKHSLPGVPSGWSELQDVALRPSQGLNLRFGLAQHGFTVLESLLRNISDPGHPSYGNHLSKDRVHALSRPSNDTIDIVEGWLAQHNASSVKWSSAQDSVSAVVPVSAAEDMLSARFGVFEHAKSGHRAGYALIASRKAPRGTQQSDFTSCVSIVDPPCVRKLFNIGNYTPDASLNNHIGVAGYLDILARADSLTLYLNDYIPESIGSNYTFDVVNITGPFTPIDFSDEGNIDTQMAIQVAYPIPMTYYVTNSVPPYIPDENQDGEVPGVNEPYLDFIDYILALDNPPTVITTSYGDDEQTVRNFILVEEKTKTNAVFMAGSSRLRQRGVPGLCEAGGQTCIANTGNNATTFLPVFPASCPYVTTVGETSGFFPQSAVSASGAGFSYYFDRPWYQDAAVSAYLAGPANANETPLQASMYDHGGRAYPDIVCTGMSIPLCGGAFFDHFFNRWDIGGGTSVAVPTAASMVALLNDWRLRNGKPTMGFLNPFLYGVGLQGLVDIAEGLVNGCEQPGFNATQGWDPASGLGFFDFGKLQSLSL
ncbi:peptidase S8/S53 domain-containing protein [Mycena epipterygia]|nr:peptidase S8/S53 domain-containing protein [Mycena epipterygia]